MVKLNVALSYRQVQELSKIVGKRNTNPFFGVRGDYPIAIVNLPVSRVPGIEELPEEEAQHEQFIVYFSEPLKAVYEVLVAELNEIDEKYSAYFIETIRLAIVNAVTEEDLIDIGNSNYVKVVEDEEVGKIVIFSSPTKTMNSEDIARSLVSENRSSEGKSR